MTKVHAILLLGLEAKATDMKAEKLSRRAGAWIFAVMILGLMALGTQAKARDVPVWVYHNFSPFIVDAEAQSGISYDLVNHLNALADGAFEFKVNVMPRARLNHMLAKDEHGVVLWANPIWFGDKDQTKYNWSEAIVEERSAVISPATAPFEYDGPASMIGRRLIGVRGHRYSGIDDLVENGSVNRFDVVSENQLLMFVASARGETAIISEPAAQFFVNRMNLTDKVHFSRNPHATYTRHVMVQTDSDELAAFVKDAVAALKTNSEWAAQLSSHSLQSRLSQ